ncbi:MULTISPECIES: hypothetical protein [unclassified Synechococcus]|uniref:hypothetical protein n=1 Tax=unclassified Synechococcus TaxID=2626047 RepID=UPI0037D9B825
MEAAQRELAASQHQLAELQALLDELPEIFERKFEQRLQPFLERQRLLAEENIELRDRLQRQLPSPPTETGAASRGEPSLPAVQPLHRLQAATQRLMGPNDRVA